MTDQVKASRLRPQVSRRPRAERRRIRRRFNSLYLFPLPMLALYAIFFLVPTLQAFQYAFTDWNGVSPTFSYVGVDNFHRALTNDNLFRNALANSVQFTLMVTLLQTALALLLAVILERNSRSSTLLRALFFFPTILSSVSVAFIWRFIYDPNVGLANATLGQVGLGSLQGNYLGSSHAIAWVSLTQVWFHAGQLMILYVAGLQQIPTDLIDAARLDGAGAWQRFRYVRWPLLAPVTTLVMVYTILQTFQAFDLIIGLDAVPPRQTMDILSTRIYTGFTNSQFGYAAAESVLLMMIIAAVVWLQRRVLRFTEKRS